MIQVSGTVVDMATGQGIPAATLAVNGQPVGAAGSSGDFILNLSGYNDQITVSSVGYKSLTVPAIDVQEAGQIQLQQDVASLETATVTAKAKSGFDRDALFLFGVVAVLASNQRKRPAKKVSGKGSNNLIPIAALGIGAYLLLKPKSAVSSTYPGSAAVPSPTSSGSPINSILSPGGISSIVDLAKNIFGSWNTSSANENTSSGTYTSYDTPGDPNQDQMAGCQVGATTTVSAGDVIGHNLVAAMRVPVYDEARDTAQPSGYISAGQTVGTVYSYLNADPSQGRSTLWWMFEPLPGNSDIGDSQGFYYAPHNPDYYNWQALADSGVLTVAQATALKSGTEPSTAEKLISKYLPWVIGGLVAVGIGKAVIQKAI